MQTVLVIGANGFSGRKILNDLSVKGKYHVVGCSLRDDIGSGQYEFYRTDIRDNESVKTLFRYVHPDIVINTSAISVPDYCENHRDEAYLTNVTAVRQIACACEDTGSRLIHLSTDFVFDGKSECLYKETDIPNPVNYYGITKIEGERQVMSCCSNYAIARVAIVYGHVLPGQHGNIFQLTANKLRNKEQIRVVSDQWRTPTLVDDVSKGTELLIQHPVNGIFHIAGNECLTIADIAYRVAKHLDLDSSLIQTVTTSEMNEPTPRPIYSGLSIEKAQKELGYQPCSLEEGIYKMFTIG